jgi:hypothetical protein
LTFYCSAAECLLVFDDKPNNRVKKKSYSLKGKNKETGNYKFSFLYQFDVIADENNRLAAALQRQKNPDPFLRQVNFRSFSEAL